MPRKSALRTPHSLNGTAPIPEDDLRPRPTNRLLWICLPMVIIGLLLIARMGWSLEMQSRADAEQWANDTVGEEVKLAQSHLASHEWDKAIAILQTALATEDATDFDKARTLLVQARQGREDAVVADAESALQQKDLAKARKLLHDFLAVSRETVKGKATRLLQEIEWATSDEKARALLQELPEATLATAASGHLPASDRVHSPFLRALYVETLRRNVAPAQALREQARARETKVRLAQEAAQQRARELRAKQVQEEIERRIARLRGTPVFRELQEFVARMRKQDRVNRAALEAFDQQLIDASAGLLTGANLTDQDRNGLKQRVERVKQDQDAALQRMALWKEQSEEQISRFRANVKERIRTYKDVDATDATLFDRLADADLDRLGNDLKKTSENIGVDL